MRVVEVKVRVKEREKEGWIDGRIGMVEEETRGAESGRV